jgi:hypothetical protein
MRFFARSFAIRSRSTASDPTPFPSPNVSHASQSGSLWNPAKYPNPQIASCGFLSLKRNGVPSSIFLGERADGCQKFTSRSSAVPRARICRASRCWYHP